MTGSTYTIFYNGTIVITKNYNQPGLQIATKEEMSDYDYSLTSHALESEFKGYEYEMEAYEGVTWSITYCDMSGDILESF